MLQFSLMVLPTPSPCHYVFLYQWWDFL